MSPLFWRFDLVRSGSRSAAAIGAAEIEPGTHQDQADRNTCPINAGRMRPEFVRRWARIARTWLSGVCESFTGDSKRFEDALHEFASSLDGAIRRAEVERELLLLVGRLLPASRCELIPTIHEAHLADEWRPAEPGNDGDEGSGAGRDRPTTPYWVEEVALRWACADFGRLRVVGFGQVRPAHARQLVRRLKILCSMAACALKSLGHGQGWPGAACQGSLLEQVPDADKMMDAVDSDCIAHYPSAVHDATFLSAILPYAIGQAQRHREPLSLVCVAIDRLHGIRELLGRATADGLIQFVGETVLSVVRESDIVARLDDDRIVAVLPRSGDAGALRIGELICQKVAESRWMGFNEPRLKITVSSGAATFPVSADSVRSLFEAADCALAEAQAHGRNKSAMAARISAACPKTVVSQGAA